MTLKLLVIFRTPFYVIIKLTIIHFNLCTIGKQLN